MKEKSNLESNSHNPNKRDDNSLTSTVDGHQYHQQGTFGESEVDQVNIEGEFFWNEI
jgi:hypothetical protein